MAGSTLVYLYAIVPADAAEPPELLHGVGGGSLRLVRAGGVAAVVGEVPADEYREDALDVRLTDLAWMGECGAAHEEVLLWLAERGPALPLALFSLHEGEERVVDRLETNGAALRERLEQIRGHQEWGVRLWRIDRDVEAQLDRISPRLRALAEEAAAAAPGRGYLLRKKREQMLGDELRAVGAEAARESFAALRDHAAEAALLPLPPGAEGRSLVLNAAFLVAEDGFPAFQREVTEVAHRRSEDGFELEFTGPWPAYHFAEADGR